jgi:hypothetical protein
MLTTIFSLCTSVARTGHYAVSVFFVHYVPNPDRFFVGHSAVNDREKYEYQSQRYVNPILVKWGDNSDGT